MDKDLIIKAVKSRLKYLELIGGTESCDVQTVEDMVSNIFNSSEELMAFKNCKRENMGEFKRLSVELCADIMIMLCEVDDFVPPILTRGSEFVISKGPKDFTFGGKINLPKSTEPMIGQMTHLSALNQVLSGIAPAPSAAKIYNGERISVSSAGVVIDPYVEFMDGYEHMIKVVQKLSKGDQACINGLYDIIVTQERSGIAVEMLKMDLRGRAFCLGFIAKLCKCKIKNMDAIINAYKDGSITPEDVKTECTEGRGKRFSAAYIFDNYK